MKFREGDCVREFDGRHEGVVVAVVSGRVRVQWNDTGWKQDCDEDELILVTHAPCVRKIGRWYIAWTPTWEGPARYDYMAAIADLRDRLEKAK